jgi:cell division protein ZipA
MSGIQWLLLVLVVAAVAVAYWYLRRQAGNDPWQGMDDDPGGDRDEPPGDSYIVGVRTLGGDEAKEAEESAEPAAGDDEPFWSAFHTDTGRPAPHDDDAASSRVGGMRPRHPPTGEESLFVLHVAGRDGALFDGPDVHAALRAQELKFGLHDIYHRITEANGVPESVYSVANMLKPGYLDPAEEDHLHTPGLVLFLVLPGPIEGVPAIRDMLDTAHALADELNGEVLDDKRTLLTPQATQYLLDQVAELDRRRRIRANR